MASSFEDDVSTPEAQRWHQVRMEGLQAFRGGSLPQAEPLLEDAVECARRLGENDPRLARSLGELAELRRLQGDLDEAEELVKHSLSIFEGRGENFHPNIVPGLNNLAGLCYARGNHAKAYSLYQMALQIWDETSQPPHPRLIPVLCNLAVLCRDRGQLPEAQAFLERACESAEEVWGKEHEGTRRCRRMFQDLLLSRAPAARPG